MSKNIKKCIAIIMLTLLLSAFSYNVAFATGYSDQMKTLIGDAENTWNDTTGASKSVNSIVSTVITIVRIICVAVALIMLLVVAMKYMSAAPGEKAEIKKSAIVYVVGAIVLFAVTGILGLINQFATAVKAG